MIRKLFCWTLLLSLHTFSQTYLGSFLKYENTGKTVTVHSDSAIIRITFYADDIARIDLLPSFHSLIETTLAVVQSPDSSISYTTEESESSLSVVTSRLIVRLQKEPLRIAFYDSAGRLLLRESNSIGFSSECQKRTLRFAMDMDDHFYGTGERGNDLDKRGLSFVSYNTQIGGYSTPLPTMNLNVPLVTTLSGYALFVDNTYRGVFDFGSSNDSILSYAVEGGEISYYFIAAATIPAQLKKYTWLTGRQPLPPRWMFGFIQSKNRYVNEPEARGIVKTMRGKNFPCDGLVLDLAWFKHMGDLSWNTSDWPNHEKMITDFLLQGIKTILITEPYIVEHSHNFKEAERNGFLGKNAEGATYFLEKWWSCGGCNAALIDVTNPDAVDWWWNKHPPAFGRSVAGIWTDLGEPEKHPESMRHYQGNSVKIHNIFNLLWAKRIFEGFNQLNPNKRVVNITRSGFAGIQRYGVLPWSGDVGRSFGGLAVQLPMLLNMGLSGIAYHHSDIGGYARNPTTPELYVRWMQFGSFSPIARAHGAGEIVNGSPTEPWKFGDEAERINREYIRLRYKLLPYNYTLAYENFSGGTPLARPLFWIDPADSLLWNESNSFMWGDAILVSPVLHAGEVTKELYLPKGKWINFWTDESVEGGRTIVVPAPLDIMPLFVKAGSIIPMAPIMNYSDEREIDTLTIHLYPDWSVQEETEYSLYEDDGLSLEYRQGKYSILKFSQALFEEGGSRNLSISISAAKGDFIRKNEKRNTIFEIHNVTGNPNSVNYDGDRCVQKKDLKGLYKSANAYYFDRSKRILRIHINPGFYQSHALSVQNIMLEGAKK